MTPRLKALAEKYTTKISHGDNSGRSFALSKKGAFEYYKSKKNKKKLPELQKQESKKDESYKKMSIKEYERKYKPLN